MFKKQFPKKLRNALNPLIGKNKEIISIDHKRLHIKGVGFLANIVLF
jgi:hypothetical protein